MIASVAALAAPGPGLADAKWAFTTRRVAPERAAGLDTDLAAARPGDLILAQVLRLGQHRNLQLATGSACELYPGDRVVLALGNRYAPDQFHASARLCGEVAHLVAGGGVIGRVEAMHEAMREPTLLRPLGRLTGPDGAALNLADFALPALPADDRPTVIVVVGASMNSGKTTAAAALAHGLMRKGQAVMGVKATGTGAFGDIHAFRDAGVAALDFTDAGMATTYRMPLPRIEAGFAALLAECARRGAETVVCELADGLFQAETRALLAGSMVRWRLDGLLFAAPDALAAFGAAQVLAGLGLRPLAISGLVSRSPLASAEAAQMTGLPVLTRAQLCDPEVAAGLVAPCRRHAHQPSAA